MFLILFFDKNKKHLFHNEHTKDDDDLIISEIDLMEN